MLQRVWPRSSKLPTSMSEHLFGVWVHATLVICTSAHVCTPHCTVRPTLHAWAQGRAPTTQVQVGRKAEGPGADPGRERRSVRGAGWWHATGSVSAWGPLPSWQACPGPGLRLASSCADCPPSSHLPCRRCEEADGEEDGDDGEAGTSLGKRRREEEDAPLKQEQPQGNSSFLPPGLIPQHDGDAGEAGDGGGAAGAAPEEAEPEGDEILSEDEHDEGQEEEEVSNLLIGQFDKVNKMKNRWKVMMKDCIFHINGRDYLFKKCTSEYTWQ